MTRKRLSADNQVPVVLSAAEISDIRQHTFLGPELLLAGIVQANGSVRFGWSLEDLEKFSGM